MEGVYLYVDVGAWTVDGASFRLHRPAEERAQLNFYCGEVQPLGIAAVAALLARDTRRSAADIERLLHTPDARATFGRALELPQRLINRLVATIVLTGRRSDPFGWEQGVDQLTVAFHRRRRTAPAGTRDVPLFIGGGGSASPFYRSAVLSTYEANQLYSTNVRRYSLEDLLLPDELAMDGLPPEQFHRFAVAYGLSIPPEEAAEIGLPSDDIDRPAPRRPRRPDAPSYEDTKDLE